jgi:hypothetical protein
MRAVRGRHVGKRLYKGRRGYRAQDARRNAVMSATRVVDHHASDRDFADAHPPAAAQKLRACATLRWFMRRAGR